MLLGKYRSDTRLAGYLALSLVQLGRNREALSVVEPAVASGARDAGLYNALALALSGLGRRQEAMSAAQEAARLKPQVAELQVNLGNLSRMANAMEQAKAAYRRAIALKPDLPAAYLGLGLVSAAEGDSVAAAERYRQALERQPGYAKAFYQLALIAKVAGGAVAPDVVEAFRQRLHSGSMPTDDAITTHSALGFLHDRAREYDAAFHHFAKFNLLALERQRRRGHSFDRQAFDRQVAEIAAAFPPGFASNHRVLSASEPQPIFIVGMPRSGTTLVEQIIAAHSAVSGGGELEALPRLIDELPGYPTDWASITAERLEAVARGYSEALAEVDRTAALVTDKLPMNFLHLGLISVLFTNAKVVYCRRDPLDTCLSIYFQNFAGNIPFANDLGDIAVAYGACERLMAHWRTVLPPGSLIEVDYEDLVTDPDGYIARLIDDLGLPWEPPCLSPPSAVRPVHTASQLQVRQPITAAAVGRWKNYRSHMGTLIEALKPNTI